MIDQSCAACHDDDKLNVNVHDDADSRRLTLEQMLDPSAMADYQAQRSNEKSLVTPQSLAASL